MNDTITAVPGIEVGHWTHPWVRTGCTVVSLPEPNVMAGEVRGGAPGSRETALLAPGQRVEQGQAILLTGGSAFGLAAADGVVRALEADGRGHDTGVVRVPIVPAAVIFDIDPSQPSVRPGPDQGEKAYLDRSAQPVPEGLVGAGAGATAAKWRGFDQRVPAGLGSSARPAGEGVVGALVVLNPVGDVFSLDGRSLTGGDPESGPPSGFPPGHTNTTLVVVATDASLTRVELSRVLVRVHDALGACVRPAHTGYDGDVAFAVSCGSAEVDPLAVGEAAFAATGVAIERAITASSRQVP